MGMKRTSFFLHMAVLSLGLVLMKGWCQSGKKLSAREIFYSAPASAKVKASESSQPQARRSGQAEKPKTVKETARRKTPSSSSKDATRQEPEAGETSLAPEAQVVQAAYSQASAVPLGLRYSILKRIGDARTVEVDADTVFRAGDRIRLSVEVNDRGYLYIIHRGSSGIWKPLFPSAEIAGGNNFVERGRTYEIPAGYVFTFDEQPGMEKLFIVLSRQPESSLEELIYSLKRGGSVAPEPSIKTKPQQPATKTLLAQNVRPIQDSLVDRLRNAYSRDLIIEKVDETTPGSKKEKAVYAVSPSLAPDARVVADVSLNHQ
jgi:hypothetical protein